MSATLDLGALGMDLVLNKGKWNQGFQDADKDIDTHQSKWKEFASNMGGKLATGIAVGVVGIGTAITGMAADGVKSAADLDDAMAKFQSSTGMTADQTNKVKDVVKDLYKTNEDSYDSLASMASLMSENMQMSADDIGKYSQKFLDYAKVTKQGNDEVVGAIDDIGDAWNLTNDQSVDTMDKMLVMQQKYGLAVTDSQAALKDMAPAAKAAGMSIDESMSYLAMFATTGVDAEVASTAFTKALTQVKSPEELKTLIKNIQDCEDPMKRAQMASDLFGAKAGPKMAQALSSGNGSLDDFIKQMDGASGAVEQAAKSYDSSFKVKWELMQKQFQSIMETIGEKFLPVLQKLMDWVQSKMPDFEKVITPIMDNVGNAIEWLMSDIVPALMDVLNSLFTLWQSLWPSLQSVFQAVWPAIQDALQLVIKSVFPVLIQLITDLMPIITKLIQTILPPLMSILDTIVPILMEVISAILPVITTLLDALLTPMQGLIQTILPPLLTLFKSLIDVILPPFKKILEMLMPPIIQLIDSFMQIDEQLMPPLLELFTVLVNTVLPPVLDIFMVLVDLIMKNFMTALNSIMPVINAVIGYFKNLIQFITDVFKGNWSGAWNDIKNIFSNLWKEVQDIVKGAWDYVVGVLSNVWDVIGSPFENVWNWVKDTWAKIGDMLWKPINDAKDLISGIVDDIKGFFTNLHIELPKIKMPHFTVEWQTGGTFADIAKVLGLPGVPKIDVEWYDKGGIFDQPTLIGVGEKRPEFVGALDDLRKIVRDEVQNAGGSGTVITGNNFHIREEADIEKTARRLYQLQRDAERAGGTA